MPDLRQAFIGAGANLSDRVAALCSARDVLRQCQGIASLSASSFYRTDPVGVPDQPWFLNAVFAIETELSPEALLAELQRIEVEHGRVRQLRWGPRTLDLDLLAYEGETRNSPELTLPHPLMFERAFVIVPLRELLKRPAVGRRAPPAFVQAVRQAKVNARGVVRPDISP